VLSDEKEQQVILAVSQQTLQRLQKEKKWVWEEWYEETG
jgi:hypothetical protein